MDRPFTMREEDHALAAVRQAVVQLVRTFPDLHPLDIIDLLDQAVAVHEDEIVDAQNESDELAAQMLRERRS